MCSICFKRLTPVLCFLGGLVRCFLLVCLLINKKYYWEAYIWFVKYVCNNTTDVALFWQWNALEVNRNAVCGSFSFDWNLLAYTHFLSLTRQQECLDCMPVILSFGSWRSGRLWSSGEITGLSSHDCGMWIHIMLKDIFTCICGDKIIHLKWFIFHT